MNAGQLKAMLRKVPDHDLVIVRDLDGARFVVEEVEHQPLNDGHDVGSFVLDIEAYADHAH